MNKKDRDFWRSEMTMLDKLYKHRMDQWQKLHDAYDLKFDENMRDLRADELVKISRFYPLVRQVLAVVAFNYPKLFFTIEDEQEASGDVADVLERGAQSLMQLMDLKAHVHQAIFDSLFCTVGWLRIDFNPPGDDLIPPYVANDAMAEDLTAANRVPPGFVHLDPMTPPHMLGYARYIREKMWVPLEQLMKDKTIKNKGEIRATNTATDMEIFGQPTESEQADEEQEARRDAINNGDFVLLDRIHDRMNKKLILFAPDAEQPIFEGPHPFAKMTFDQRMDSLGQPIMEEDGQTPVVDIAKGKPAVGWLVENGFPFVALKFDLHGDSFYPLPHLAYIDDLQNVIVESMSRQAQSLKRQSRQGLAKEEEIEDNPELLDSLRKGQDGDWHKVKDPNNFRELIYGSMPGDQFAIEDRSRGYEEEISQVAKLESGAGTAKTATEAAVIAGSASINREWMTSKVADTYSMVVRDCFQVMGDPRYTPENFALNVAPEGSEKFIRALTAADFLWTFRIEVRAASMQPLVEQIEGAAFREFYSMAKGNPNFDDRELDKRLALSAKITDYERLMVDDQNVEALQAAQLENNFMIGQFSDPGVLPEQDHRAHITVHEQYQEHPQYQQLVQQAAVNPQAVQMIQMIDQLIQQHGGAHAQAEADAAAGVTSAPASTSNAITAEGSLHQQVASNAQTVSNKVQADAAN